MNGICYCEICMKPCQVYGSRWCKDCHYPGIDRDNQPASHTNLGATEQPPCTNEFVAEGCEQFPEPKPTYEQLEALYNAQCQCTDEWAAKARERGDPVVLARIADLEAHLATVNERLSEQNKGKP